MITKKIETIEGPITLNVKTDLKKEITVDQYERVINCLKSDKSDPAKTIEITSVLSDIQENTILQATEVDKAINTLGGIVNDMIVQWEEDILQIEQKNDKGETVIIIPRTVRFENLKKDFSIERNLSFYPLGARIAAENIIREEMEANGITTESGEVISKLSIKAGIELLANYFYSYITGMPYDDIQVLAFMAEIRLLNALDFIALNKYFFLNYPNFLVMKEKFWEGMKREIKARLAKKK